MSVSTLLIVRHVNHAAPVVEFHFETPIGDVWPEAAEAARDFIDREELGNLSVTVTFGRTVNLREAVECMLVVLSRSFSPNNVKFALNPYSELKRIASSYSRKDVDWLSSLTGLFGGD